MTVMLLELNKEKHFLLEKIGCLSTNFVIGSKTWLYNGYIPDALII